MNQFLFGFVLYWISIILLLSYRWDSKPLYVLIPIKLVFFGLVCLAIVMTRNGFCDLVSCS